MSTTNGSVKWFNKGAGYGFITATDGDHKGDDIFVHHSGLVVSDDQFRYLVEGEHVSFEWSSVSDVESKKWQATNVTGANGGKLMCETRNTAPNDQASGDETSSTRTNGRGRGRGLGLGRGRGRDPRSGGRFRSNGPCVTDANGVEYRLVPTRRKSSREENSSEE